MREWIKFKDRWPPKKLKEILVFEVLEHIKTHKKIPHFSIEKASDIYLFEDEVYSHSGGENITHWMPLPSPPEKQDN